MTQKRPTEDVTFEPLKLFRSLEHSETNVSGGSIFLTNEPSSSKAMEQGREGKVFFGEGTLDVQSHLRLTDHFMLYRLFWVYHARR